MDDRFESKFRDLPDGLTVLGWAIIALAALNVFGLLGRGGELASWLWPTYLLALGVGILRRHPYSWYGFYAGAVLMVLTSIVANGLLGSLGVLVVLGIVATYLARSDVRAKLGVNEPSTDEGMHG